jgi:hypothetical protein
MPAEVFAAWQEMYPEIESLEDLRTELDLDGIPSCADAYSFVEGHELEESTLDNDRNEYLAGESIFRATEKRAEKLANSKGTAHGAFDGLASFRDARFRDLCAFIRRCNNISHLEGKGGLERGCYSRYQASKNLGRNELVYLTYAQLVEISRLCAARKTRINRKDWRDATPMPAMRTSRAKRKASGITVDLSSFGGECLDFRTPGFIGPVRELR